MNVDWTMSVGDIMYVASVAIGGIFAAGKMTAMLASNLSAIGENLAAIKKLDSAIDNVIDSLNEMRGKLALPPHIKKDGE